MSGGAGWRTICAQEATILADVDALRVSKKPEIIGAMFEDRVREFLATLAPEGLDVVPGFIVSRDGVTSSHFDVLVVDRSYPYLAAIGPHRFVMAPAVVAAMELTTHMDGAKLRSMLRKAREIERVSLTMYAAETWPTIGFTGVSVEARIGAPRIAEAVEGDASLASIYTLRAPPGSQHAIHCWMEGAEGEVYIRETNSPLADLVAMELQGCINTMRSRDRDTAGDAMNDYIHWGTQGASTRGTPFKK